MPESVERATLAAQPLGIWRISDQMNFKHFAAAMCAAVLLLVIGFGAGLFWSSRSAPSDTTRQELIRRLVSTKAALQAGLTFAGLGTEETQLRATAELADRRLNTLERKAVWDTIFAMHQTRSAWENTIRCGRSCYKEDLDEIQQYANSLSVNFDWTQHRVLMGWSDYQQSEIIRPFLSECLSKIKISIDILIANDQVS